MTFGILCPYAYPHELKATRQFKKNFRRFDYFYEHGRNTAGFIFRASDLEAYVSNYKRDPVLRESNPLRNYADWFANVLRQNLVAVFLVPHLNSQEVVIAREYLRFEVWEKIQKILRRPNITSFS